MLTFKKNNLKTFIYLLIYKLLLDISYVLFINKYFEYMGFRLEYNGYKFTLGMMLFTLIYIFVPKDQEKPSSVFIQLLFIIMLIPMFTIYSLMNQSTLFMLANSLFFMFQCLLLRLLPNMRIVRVKNSKKILYGLLLIVTSFVYISMIRANGLPSYTTLNILNVYDVRSGVVYPVLMNYLVTWQAKVINPILITVAFLKNKRKLLIVSIMLQIIIYMITAHKSFLFIPVAIIFVTWLLKKVNFFKLSTATAASGTFILLIYYLISNSIILPSTFLRRLIFVPAHIKFSYYDFFSSNSYMYFSLGVIGEVFGITYPYDKHIANIIGEVYYNSPNMWTNTGYLADAYANMGYFGMLVISLIFVIVLKSLDSLSVNVGKELTVGIALFSILSLNDGALLTTLLTGGLLFLLVLLFIYSNNIDE